MSLAEAHETTTEPFRLAGFPLAKWAFACRIWLAMMVALYAAFWLQLDSASSSAVTVAILAQPRRGQAFQKAIYRLGATVLGFAASIAITGLLAQSRDLFVVAFAGWMAFAVYLATCYDGQRAYGAVLSGYTVAIISVMQIDTPQDVFTTGISRVAVVALGIASIALIDDVLAAPDVWPAVRERLLAAHAATRDHVRSLIHGEDRGPDRSAQVLGDIVGTRLDILSLPSESPKGLPRSEAAKSAAAAMVASIFAARSFAMLSARLPEHRDLVLPTALEAADVEPIAAALDTEMKAADRSVDRIMLLHCALYLAERMRVAGQDLAAMQAARWPQRRVSLPIHRDREAARRAAARVFMAVCAASILFIHSSWPMTSVSFSLLGVFAGLSATTPDPRAFAKGAVIGISIAIPAAGITEFLILDGADQFPILAIGMAPAVFAACFMLLDPKLGAIGFLLLVFLPVLFPPSNPQSYNPQSYVLTSCLAMTAIVVLAFMLSILLPTNDRDRRRWMVNAARRDLLRVASGETRRSAPVATYLTADRLVALARFKIGGPAGKQGRLAYMLLLSSLTNAAARGLDALARLKICRAEAERGRDAFGSLQPAALRDAAAALARAELPDDATVRMDAACAIAALQFSALLIETNASTLRHLRWALDR